MASAAKSSKVADKREEPEESAGKAAAATAKKPGGLLLLILGCGLLSAVMASGATWLLASRHPLPQQASGGAEKTADDSSAKAAPEQPALYLDMTPAFVVNLADEGSMRFLQVEVQVMARDQKVIEAVKDHSPRIRNALMLLFSQQHAHDIATREAKEALQKQAMDEVVQALQQESAPSEVGAIYFTSFVMQ